MRLVDASYNLNLLFSENQKIVLVIENPKYMNEVVQGLYQQSLGQEGDFLLSDKEKEVQIGKAIAVLIDPFSLDFNDKKIINKVYAELAQQATDLYEEKEKVNAEVINILDRIIGMSQYDNLSFNLELDWMQILKTYNVHIDAAYTGTVEKLLEYEKILVNILHHRIFCMVNMKTYLAEEELLEIYKMADYLKLQLLLIEARESEVIEGEKIIIIDKDRCTIVK